jgi:hypothetical protein
MDRGCHVCSLLVRAIVNEGTPVASLVEKAIAKNISPEAQKPLIARTRLFPDHGIEIGVLSDMGVIGYLTLDFLADIGNTFRFLLLYIFSFITKYLSN